MLWAWRHWLPNLDQEHGKLVIPISALIIWYHRKRLRAAAESPIKLGLVAFWLRRLLLVLLGTRAQQPRITLLGLPVLLFGVVLTIWGRQVAQNSLFPIFFLVFMIPVGALAAGELPIAVSDHGRGSSHFFTDRNTSLDAVGTTLREAHGAWGFDIAEGCSGIRSLVAIIMLTAIYAHVFEPALWKKFGSPGLLHWLCHYRERRSDFYDHSDRTAGLS